MKKIIVFFSFLFLFKISICQTLPNSIFNDKYKANQLRGIILNKENGFESTKIGTNIYSIFDYSSKEKWLINISNLEILQYSLIENSSLQDCIQKAKNLGFTKSFDYRNPYTFQYSFYYLSLSKVSNNKTRITYSKEDDTDY